MKSKQSIPQVLILASVIYFFAWMMTLGTSCKHEPLLGDIITPIDSTDTIGIVDTIPIDTPCDPDSVYFEAQVLPILISSCAKSGCHDAASHEEGIIMDSYANVMQTAEVKPFDLNSGKLYEVITETDPDKRMPQPPNAPLTQDQIQLIANWIQQGAQNLKCDPDFGACDSLNVSFSQTLNPILNTYCVGCHSGPAASGGVSLDAYSGVKTVAQSGKLYGVISWETGFPQMPQGGNQLDACTIAKFKSWIDAGAPEN
jgi:Planctomycete cytochrome C